MRKGILIIVIVIGLGAVVVAGYFLFPLLKPQTQTAKVAPRGECAIEADVASVAWPSGLKIDIKNKINATIEKAAAGLLDAHLPPNTPPHTSIIEAQNALVEWCKNNHIGADRYSVDVNAEVTLNAGGVLSLRIVDSYKTGAVASARGTGIVFDTTSGKNLSLTDMIKPGQLSAFAAIEHKKLLSMASQYLYENPKSEINSAIDERAAIDWYAKHGFVTVTAGAIIVSYNPGDIGRRPPGGIVNVSISKSELVNILK